VSVPASTQSIDTSKFGMLLDMVALFVCGVVFFVIGAEIRV
jgi:hypothetical protein